MATITLKGNEIQTCGALPAIGSTAPAASLLGVDLQRKDITSIEGKKLLNIFPSIDTPVCQKSVVAFNTKAADRGVTVVNISEDLPFAHKRFCGAEGIEGVQSMSAFRTSFAQDYGVEITSGALTGLTSRAVVVLDGDNKVLYTEQVPEIAQEPDYDAALAAL